MNQEEFINGIKIAVGESAYKSMLSILLDPPGRSPSVDSLQLSEWYNSLQNNDREMIGKVIQGTIDMTVFGCLCVLDGVKTIEPQGDKGKFELYFIKGATKVLLNDINDDFLHDLWNAE